MQKMGAAVHRLQLLDSAAKARTNTGSHNKQCCFHTITPSIIYTFLIFMPLFGGSFLCLFAALCVKRGLQLGVLHHACEQILIQEEIYYAENYHYYRP